MEEEEEDEDAFMSAPSLSTRWFAVLCRRVLARRLQHGHEWGHGTHLPACSACWHCTVLLSWQWKRLKIRLKKSDTQGRRVQGECPGLWTEAQVMERLYSHHILRWWQMELGSSWHLLVFQST